MLSKYRIPVLVLAFVFPTLLTWVYFSLLSQSPSWIQQAAYGILKPLQFLLPIAWFWWDRHCFANATPNASESVGEPELNTRSRLAPWPSLTWGLVFGAGVGVLLWLIYFYGIALWPEGELLKKAVVEKIEGLQLDSPFLYLALGVFYSLIHSFLEEYYWRWFVFQMCLTRMAFWPAAILSSVGFMAHHVILLTHFFGWTSWLAWSASFSVAVGGVFWCWLYRQSKNLVMPWLSHLVVDAAIFGLGYFMVRDLF